MNRTSIPPHYYNHNVGRTCASALMHILASTVRARHNSAVFSVRNIMMDNESPYFRACYTGDQHVQGKSKKPLSRTPRQQTIAVMDHGPCEHRCRTGKPSHHLRAVGLPGKAVSHCSKEHVEGFEKSICSRTIELYCSADPILQWSTPEADKA